jgi:hypothetical protein
MLSQRGVEMPKSRVRFEDAKSHHSVLYRSFVGIREKSLHWCIELVTAFEEVQFEDEEEA